MSLSTHFIYSGVASQLDNKLVVRVKFNSYKRMDVNGRTLDSNNIQPAEVRINLAVCVCVC